MELQYQIIDKGEGGDLMRNRILIVDDSLFNRQVLKDILKGKYELVEASDGEDALELIEEQKNEIAAVLLDIVMPKMDGIALLKELNAKKYLSEFPVLMVTGEKSFETLAECFKYGASDYIRKPVHQDYVIEKVEKLVVGNPLEKQVDIVPLIDTKSALFVEGLINDAINKGGQCIVGGKREENIIYPTLIDYVTEDMELAWEEPFGPVLPIIRVIRKGVFPLVQILIPIGLIIYGTIDLGKAVIASDEKEVKAYIKRAVTELRVDIKNTSAEFKADNKE